MFTLIDLLDQVECQGRSKVLLIEDNDELVLKEVFCGDDLRQVPYEIGCKELVYIYSGANETTYYEVRE